MLAGEWHRVDKPPKGGIGRTSGDNAVAKGQRSENGGDDGQSHQDHHAGDGGHHQQELTHDAILRVPEGVEVTAAEGLEGHHGAGGDDARQASDAASDDVGKVVVVAHADDGDDVALPGHGVDLGDAFEAGEFRREVGDATGLGVDEHEGGKHDVRLDSPQAAVAPTPGVGRRAGRAASTVTGRTGSAHP